MKRVVAGLAFVVAALGWAPAFAHVSVEANSARPGDSTTLTLHVPNESATADTVRVDVQLPDGFEFLGGTPAKGWTADAAENVVAIEGGRIPPGASRNFRIRIRNAPAAGSYEFPAIQTYADGDRVRWIGDKGADRPAAVLTLKGKPVRGTSATDASAPTEEAADAVAPEATPSAPASEAAQSPDQGGGAPLLAIGAAVLAGGIAAAVLRARRR